MQSFTQTDGHLTLEISDNGQGFNPALVDEDGLKSARGGNGLASMRQRASELVGKFNITSEAGHGTIVSLNVPITGPMSNLEAFPTLTGGDGQLQKR